MAFTILLFFLILKTFRLADLDDSKDEFVDEKIFTIAQCLGILSGVMGLLLTFNLIEKSILINKLWIYFPWLLISVPVSDPVLR